MWKNVTSALNERIREFGTDCDVEVGDARMTFTESDVYSIRK
jgi:hypothetical protein